MAVAPSCTRPGPAAAATHPRITDTDITRAMRAIMAMVAGAMGETAEGETVAVAVAAETGVAVEMGVAVTEMPFARL